MENEYSRAGFMPDLWVDMSVSFCLPHPVAVILSFVVDCVLVLRRDECVRAVCEFWVVVRPTPFGCVSMGIV